MVKEQKKKSTGKKYTWFNQCLCSLEPQGKRIETYLLELVVLLQQQPLPLKLVVVHEAWGEEVEG